MMKRTATFLLLISVCGAQPHDNDRFNYVATDFENRNFGPRDWEDVDCPDVTNCTGWPDDWRVAINWTLSRNDCRWCPSDKSTTCDEHHQSPIALTRKWADEDSKEFNICKDDHWMKYEDSSCTWEDLDDSFTIERHALKLSHPVEFNEAYPNGYRLDCSGRRRFGRIDYSWGFNAWWFLNFIDIKMPSEHTQNGKRYTAEVQHTHFFEKDPLKARNRNEMATMSVLLQAEEHYPSYPHLDRMICQWREVEARTRSQCNLDPIPDPYPGCFRPLNTTARRTREEDTTSRRTSFSDYMKYHHGDGPLYMDKENFRPTITDEEFEEFIEGQSKRDLYEQSHYPFHSYQFLIDSRTEYYFRYHGTTSIPPCYGTVPDVWGELDGHQDTNHWRVMKDPIRISMRQKNEMERLLRERIAPPDDRHNPCQADTAAAVDDEGHVSVARPLQAQDPSHMARFCTCGFWTSKWPEDRAWCEIGKEKGDQHLFYDRPYNYEGPL